MSHGRSNRRRHLTITHAHPLGRETVSCCGVRAVDLPRTARVSIDPKRVTCSG